MDLFEGFGWKAFIIFSLVKMFSMAFNCLIHSILGHRKNRRKDDKPIKTTAVKSKVYRHLKKSAYKKKWDRILPCVLMTSMRSCDIALKVGTGKRQNHTSDRLIPVNLRRGLSCVWGLKYARKRLTKRPINFEYVIS